MFEVLFYKSDNSCILLHYISGARCYSTLIYFILSCLSQISCDCIGGISVCLEIDNRFKVTRWPFSLIHLLGFKATIVTSHCENFEVQSKGDVLTVHGWLKIVDLLTFSLSQSKAAKQWNTHPTFIAVHKTVELLGNGVQESISNILINQKSNTVIWGQEICYHMTMLWVTVSIYTYT